MTDPCVVENLGKKMSFIKKNPGIRRHRRTDQSPERGIGIEVCMPSRNFFTNCPRFLRWDNPRTDRNDPMRLYLLRAQRGRNHGKSILPYDDGIRHNGM